MGTVSLKWIDSQLMVAVDSFGHPVVTGSWPGQEPEWAALKPSDLLLISAAACTAHDVVMILAKQRQDLQGLEISCTGTQDPDPPYAFKKIHLHYLVSGDVDAKSLERAIYLSEEKYCSVINTLKPTVEFSSDYELRK